LVDKLSKKSGLVRTCPNEACTYERAVAEV